MTDLAKAGNDSLKENNHRDTDGEVTDAEKHLQQRHFQARLQYAKDKLEKDHGHWKHIAWFVDYTRVFLLLIFGERRERCITQRRPSPHGGGSITVWCFRNLVKVERITRKGACVQIWKENLTAALSFNVATIQNILVINYQQKIKMGAVDWPVQSPDLKPTGMMWRLRSLPEDHQIWRRDSKNNRLGLLCVRLVDNYNSWLHKGNPALCLL